MSQSVPKKRRTEPPTRGGAAQQQLQHPPSPTLQGRSLSPEAKPPPPAGDFLVMKFGGSSMGQIKRLPSVLELIKSTIADESTPPRLVSPRSLLCAHRTAEQAVVVSAMGDTTDWLLDAAEYAVKGDQEGAELLVDRISDLVTTNAIVTVNASNHLTNPPDFVRLVREFLVPLRQVLMGMCLTHEKTSQASAHR